MKSGEIVFLGVLLMLLGFALVFTGLSKGTVFTRDDSKGEVRGGGIVMIGPFPIIFGTDRSSVAFLIALAILLVVVSYLIFRGG
jgi:uncharacterized protein (TIGR00304 family)